MRSEALPQIGSEPSVIMSVFNTPKNIDVKHDLFHMVEMNLRRETGASLGMGGSTNSVQIDPGNFRNFQSQPEAQCNPIT